MFAAGCELEHHDDEHEHEEVGHYCEYTYAEGYCYYLGFQDDLGADQLQTVRAPHLYRAGYGDRYLYPYTMACHS